jgi:hypothetical protein
MAASKVPSASQRMSRLSHSSTYDYFSSLTQHDPSAFALEPHFDDYDDYDDDELIIQQFPTTPQPRNDTSPMEEIQVPTHPIPAMQGAFAESMQEASENSSPASPKPDLLDAATRRRVLLDQDITSDTHAAKWKQKPGQQYHELWKLMYDCLLNPSDMFQEHVLSSIDRMHS